MNAIVKFRRTACVGIWGHSGVNKPSRVLHKGLNGFKIDCKCLASRASVAWRDKKLPILACKVHASQTYNLPAANVVYSLFKIPSIGSAYP